MSEQKTPQWKVDSAFNFVITHIDPDRTKLSDEECRSIAIAITGARYEAIREALKINEKHFDEFTPEFWAAEAELKASCVEVLGGTYYTDWVTRLKTLKDKEL